MEKTNRFRNEKENRLGLKEDISRKGSIDEPIRELIAIINNCANYYTTSSCSGRCLIFGNNHQMEEEIHQKKGIKWLFVSHNYIEVNDIMKAIEENQKNETTCSATFKLEPFILHVCCNGLTNAKLLLNCAISCGFRNSGLTISKSDRIIVAIRSTHSLEIPIISENELIVSQNYIQYITQIANQKLRQNFERIDKFYLAVKSLCDNINNV